MFYAVLHSFLSAVTCKRFRFLLYITFQTSMQSLVLIAFFARTLRASGCLRESFPDSSECEPEVSMVKKVE